MVTTRSSNDISTQPQTTPGSTRGGQSSVHGQGQPSTRGQGQPSTRGRGQPSTRGRGQPSTRGRGQPSTRGQGQTSTRGGGITTRGGGNATHGTGPSDRGQEGLDERPSPSHPLGTNHNPKEQNENKEAIGFTLDNFQNHLDRWTIPSLRKVLNRRKKNANRIPTDVQEVLNFQKTNYTKIKLMLALIGRVSEKTINNWL
ncbi:hypothetical protein PtA15_10A125 [Puccinia triticina]|uniref:Uncharacterized protein n=1 Tax=Puccinia triticina TaxID=208348 RepID=A0ABY7CX63_9BASI|nr:uncharacterized protein PtA15_10A125 [Puccinia triticina]WAQ88706.1 hypothetical protein PtA15_10A125 [Puccinia triticina]